MQIITVSETVGNRRSQWGEGPLWWADRLWYTDIEGRAIVALDPTSGEESVWPTDQRIGLIVPARDGSFVVAGDEGVFSFDPSDSRFTPIAAPEPGEPDNRFNDGKCDAKGRLWAGTISLVKKTGAASLYRILPDGSHKIAYPNVTNSNGLDWSPDGKSLYYIDTPTRQVLHFDFDLEQGEIHNPRPVIQTGDIDASPDGMTVDAEGFLWIAFCHGGCVRRYDPSGGQAVLELRIPALETTSVTFGGENLETLFITTGKHKTLVEEEAGAVFQYQAGVKGKTAHAFGE